MSLEQTRANRLLLRFAKQGNFRRIKRCIARNHADPDYITEDNTSVIMAAINEDVLDPSALRVLLELCEKTINHQDNFKTTALIKAAKAGYWEAVLELLKAGADPLLKNAEGHSALYYAILYEVSAFIKKGCFQIIQELLLDKTPKLEIVSCVNSIFYQYPYHTRFTLNRNVMILYFKNLFTLICEEWEKAHCEIISRILFLYF